MSRLFNSVVALFCFASCYQASARAGNCNLDATCVQQAAAYAAQVRSAFTPLGPYIADGASAEAYINYTFKLKHPQQYAGVFSAIKAVNKWTNDGTDTSRTGCFNRQMLAQATPGENTGYQYWWIYFTRAIYTGTLRSPEFVHGRGLNINLNQGIISPGTNREQYGAMAEGFLSFTFTRKGKSGENNLALDGHEKSGGKVRLMMGASVLYSKQTTWLLCSQRAEIRLRDLQLGGLTSVGCFKLLVQTGFNDKLVMAGAGVGFETAFLNVQILQADYDITHNNVILLTGIGYRMYRHY